MGKEYQIDDQIEAYCESCDVVRPQIVSGIGAKKQVTRSKCPRCSKSNRYRKTTALSGKLAAGPRQPATPYVINDRYEQGGIMQHPLFGRGEVVGLIGSGKIEVLFRDRLRCLVHGRETASNGDGAP